MTKTSIFEKVQASNDVWGSGSKIVLSNGKATVTCAGADEGGWGGKIGATPLILDAGDLAGYTHIVIEADISGFTENKERGGENLFDLKVEDTDTTNKKEKIIPFNFVDGKAEIPLETVDFLSTANQILFSFRGTGDIVITDISKAK